MLDYDLQVIRQQIMRDPCSISLWQEALNYAKRCGLKLRFSFNISDGLDFIYELWDIKSLPVMQWINGEYKEVSKEYHFWMINETLRTDVPGIFPSWNLFLEICENITNVWFA